MEDDAQRRAELIRSVREASQSNASAMRSSSRMQNAGKSMGMQEVEIKSTFKIRCIVSVVLFLGFYIFWQLGGSILNVKADTLVSEVSKNISAEAVMNQFTDWAGIGVQKEDGIQSSETNRQADTQENSTQRDTGAEKETTAQGDQKSGTTDSQTNQDGM